MELNAMRETKEGVIIDIEVSPGSKKTEIKGYNNWRKRIEIRLSAKATKGKANEELITFISDSLNINSSNVKIISGMKSHTKSLMIHGLKIQDIVKFIKDSNAQ